MSDPLTIDPRTLPAHAWVHSVKDIGVYTTRIQELDRQIKHLERSNQELQEEIDVCNKINEVRAKPGAACDLVAEDEERSDTDTYEYRIAIDENVAVIESKRNLIAYLHACAKWRISGQPIQSFETFMSLKETEVMSAASQKAAIERREKLKQNSERKSDDDADVPPPRSSHSALTAASVSNNFDSSSMSNGSATSAQAERTTQSEDDDESRFIDL